jgi:hypothetical protein
VSVTNFAFLGRCSTEDQQDPESSRGWQRSRAVALIEPRGGVIVAEYFDVGESRSLPWQRRPQASALLRALRDPQRGFDAVVIGEPHRAFYGNQFGLTFPLFTHYGVQLWVPEVGGPLDADNEAHDLVMSVFGGMSKVSGTGSRCGCGPRWPRRRTWKAASWAAGRRTGTGSSTWARTPTRRRPPTAGSFTVSLWTRPPRR